MKIFMAPFLALVLLCPSCHSKWTTHTACKDDKLELLYQSCGYNIKELFLDVNLFAMGKSVYSFSYPVCETDFPQFSFCGRRKGENIYYAGDINKPAFPIVKGEYHILLRLYNENNSTVVCANFTVLSY
ncbi:lymphocyte antigen 86 isoform X2 [Phascolarctos cinereus]